ncbi:MAG: VOC family protein [Prolixibacteraceae bacterium]|nr:VOC family protein [Prolixibacteraceae bacterium]MBN2774153.1 VOC family protein [Prolixibacteraceae bacterium]
MQIIPTLVFNGDCEEALTFYKKCLGGKILYLERYKDAPSEFHPKFGERILHSKFEFNGNTLYASDSIEGKRVVAGDNQTLTVEFDSKEQLTEVYELISEGASIKTPLQESFWGTSYAILTDRYGIKWNLNFTRVMG